VIVVAASTPKEAVLPLLMLGVIALDEVERKNTDPTKIANEITPIAFIFITFFLFLFFIFLH
jgi:hypothetical protein